MFIWNYNEIWICFKFVLEADWVLMGLSYRFYHFIYFSIDYSYTELKPNLTAMQSLLYQVKSSLNSQLEFKSDIPWD